MTFVWRRRCCCAVRLLCLLLLASLLLVCDLSLPVRLSFGVALDPSASFCAVEVRLWPTSRISPLLTEASIEASRTKLERRNALCDAFGEAAEPRRRCEVTRDFMIGVGALLTWRCVYDASGVDVAAAEVVDAAKSISAIVGRYIVTL